MNAQKQNIQNAINSLKEKDVATAKKYIDEAVANPATNTNAKAWMLRGIINQAIIIPSEYLPKLQFILDEKMYEIDLASANSLKGANPNAFEEAVNSYNKSLSYDKKYSKQEVMPLITAMVLLGFNSGINEMNSSKFNEAAQSFQNVLKVAQIDEGKPFKGEAGFDTLFTNCKLYQGNCYYQIGKEDDAIPLLEEAAKNPITQKADVYVMLTDIYERKGNTAKWSEVMKEAKAKYPNDKRLINNEINYYLKLGKGEESIAKLKEGIAAEPNKADLHIILGQTYYNMATPKDEKGNAKPAPANAKELEQNALKSFSKAIELDPKNPYPQFYSGILFFNTAKDLTDEMNKADDKKYKEIEPKRNEQLNLAIPFLEKAKTFTEAEGLNDGNREMYKQILSGLSQAYMITDKAEKSTEMQNLLNKQK
ncbi:MAG TPA: hypothetical protein PKA54_08575 [Chitinophagaceae bacterium]|nr:hypothetical protein [Chitinophagaceae bacterium]